MDMVHFSGIEVLDMAIKIEENGERFYADASRMAKTKRLKELFLFLAKEEVRHAGIFKKLKKDAEKTDPQTDVFSPYIEEASLYLKSIADTEVFKTIDEGSVFGKNMLNEKAALNYAIDKEKDSLLFYYELKEAVRERDKDILNEVIEEEKSHLRKLAEIKTTL